MTIKVTKEKLEQWSAFQQSVLIHHIKNNTSFDAELVSEMLAFAVFCAKSQLSECRHQNLAMTSFKVGSLYKWKARKERLVYLGHNRSGNGHWHQFALADDPSKEVWCEVLTSELHYLEPITEGGAV